MISISCLSIIAGVDVCCSPVVKVKVLVVSIDGIFNKQIPPVLCCHCVTVQLSSAPHSLRTLHTSSVSVSVSRDGPGPTGYFTAGLSP